MVTFNGWMVRRAGVPANGRYLVPDDRVVRPFVSGMRSCRPTARAEVISPTRGRPARRSADDE